MNYLILLSFLGKGYRTTGQRVTEARIFAQSSLLVLFLGGAMLAGLNENSKPKQKDRE